MVERPDLVTKNLAAFEKYYPELFPRLRDHQPYSQLIEIGEDDYDVEFRGTRLFPDGARAAAQRVLDEVRAQKAPRLLIVMGPESKTFDAPTNRFSDAARAELGTADIEIVSAPTVPQCFHVASFGLGLGLHLDDLMELTQARSLFIAEPNLDFLHHSLRIYDWEKLLATRPSDPFSFTISLEEIPEAIAQSARVHFRMGAPIATDGLTFVQLYANSVMDQARELFRRDAHLIHTGLGFMADEMEMVRANYHNFKGGDFNLFTRLGEHLHVPVFVVGSGPSIDEDLDFIRENQHRAIIISCGSALGVLLRNGIRPDFQAQLENSEVPHLMLKTIADAFPLTGISLIASMTISPNTRHLFDRSIFFVRAALSSSAMFWLGPEHMMDEPGPTVTNTGLGAALCAGFRQIYLFGVDMGARQADRHHSVSSPYDMDGSEADYADKKKIQFEQEFTRRAVGNLGGIVFTDTIMEWSRDTHERTIRRYRFSNVFNCSDGARIVGARPMISEEIELTSTPEDKLAALAVLEKGWPLVEVAPWLRAWHETPWRDHTLGLIDAVEAVVNETPLTEYHDFSTVIHKLSRLLLPDIVRRPRFEEFFLRGTILMSVAVFDNFAKRVSDPARQEEAFAILKHQYSFFLAEIRHQVNWYFDNLDNIADQGDLTTRLAELAA